MPTCPGPLTGSLTGPSIFANQGASEQAPSSSVTITNSKLGTPLSHIYADLQPHRLFLT